MSGDASDGKISIVFFFSILDSNQLPENKTVKALLVKEVGSDVVLNLLSAENDIIMI